MRINWQLWDNFVAAAQECDIQLDTTDPGCVRLILSEPVQSRFYAQCWTPFNKLPLVLEQSTFDLQLKCLRDNVEDFHLEFGARLYQDGGMCWFPRVLDSRVTRQEIVDAIVCMQDTKNFEKLRVLALLRQPEELCI
jgi:hypothetical protein